MEEPTRVGRYEVIRLLGRGGMGSVYLARDPAIDRQVAIKVLSASMDATARDRFAREARSAGRLHHERIVTIFDVGEHEGHPFIAMEYVPGETLATILRADPPPPLGERLRLVEDACVGLGYAHQSGVVHLDVKPENLIRAGDGRVKVLDFGIARLVESGDTQTRSVLGTLRYMSPEQLAARDVDRRSDVYAIGCVLYEAIAGQPAFDGTIGEMVSRIGAGRVTPLAMVVPDVHPDLARIVARAMAVDPARRYQDVDTLRHDLSMARREIEGPSSSTTGVVPPRPDGKRHRESFYDFRKKTPGVFFRVAAVAGLAAVAAGAWVWWPDAVSPPAGEPPPPVMNAADPGRTNAPETSPPSSNPETAPANRPARGAGAQTDAARGRGITTGSPEHAPAPPRPAPDAGQTQTQPPAQVQTPPAGANPDPPQPPPAGLSSSVSRGAVPAGPPVTTLGGGPPAPTGGKTQPTAEEAVRATLQAYAAAYEARDLAGVRRVYPRMTQAEANSLAEEFRQADSYSMDVAVIDVLVTGASAVATCDVTREVVLRIARAPQTTSRTTFHLQLAGGAWAIERVIREVR
jgi:serine/threonine-protein kinase